MKTFTVYRPNVPSTHTDVRANAPDKPQFEGIIFSDGTCTIRWLTSKGSTAVWSSFEDMFAIHGHLEYGTYIVWHNGAVESVTPSDHMLSGSQLEFAMNTDVNGVK